MQKAFLVKNVFLIILSCLYKPIYEKFFVKLFMRFKILTYFKSKKKIFCETFLAIKNTYVFYIYKKKRSVSKRKKHLPVIHHSPVIYHPPSLYHLSSIYHPPVIYHQPVVYHQPGICHPPGITQAKLIEGARPCAWRGLLLIKYFSKCNICLDN